jgi:molybdopterin-guanine dinucleotide biosynthesis adapter protein
VSIADPATPAASNPAHAPTAIAISGPSGSGKTHLICRLLQWFAPLGLAVAVLKHTHHSLPEDEHKDTGRYRQAGARLAALAAPGLVQLTRNFPAEPPLDTVLALLARESDLILVEGYKASALPKIALAAGSLEVPDYPNIIALVSPAAVPGVLPVFHPDQTAEIGRFILEFLGLAQRRPAGV